jgi:cytochrome c-type biogenesis protein CcmH/NrfG
MNVTCRFFAVLVCLLSAALCFSQSGADQTTTLADHIRKAREFLDEKRPDLAIPELQAAVAIDPSNAETQGNLGVLLYFQGKVAEAIPHLRAAVERQPGLGKIQGLLGLGEVHTLEVVRGREDLESAFPVVDDPKFKVQVGLELISLYTQKGDLEEANRVLTQLRKAAPDDPEVLYAAYRTYSDLAGESMLALSLAAPDSAQMHQVMAHEEFRQGNSNGAVAEFRKAIAIDPHLPGIHFELAELLHSSQDEGVKKEAEKEYRAALAENPQDAKSILRLADIDAQKRSSQQALEEYRKAVALQPRDPDAKLGLAKILTEMNQANEALPLLEDAVRLDPTNATAHYRLSTLYRKIGRSDDSKKEVELYKKYKDLKEKLRVVYKDLQLQPDEISGDKDDQK